MSETETLNRHKLYRLKNKEQVNQRQRERRQTPEGQAKQAAYNKLSVERRRAFRRCRSLLLQHKTISEIMTETGLSYELVKWSKNRMDSGYG